MTVTLPRRSSILGIAVEVYVRHRLDAAGRCGFCQRPDCDAAQHSARYFRAIGIDPADYDGLSADDLAGDRPPAAEPAVDLPVAAEPPVAIELPVVAATAGSGRDGSGAL